MTKFYKSICWIESHQISRFFHSALLVLWKIAILPPLHIFHGKEEPESETDFQAGRGNPLRAFAQSAVIGFWKWNWLLKMKLTFESKINFESETDFWKVKPTKDGILWEILFNQEWSPFDWNSRKLEKSCQSQ